MFVDPDGRDVIKFGYSGKFPGVGSFSGGVAISFPGFYVGELDIGGYFSAERREGGLDLTLLVLSLDTHVSHLSSPWLAQVHR